MKTVKQSIFMICIMVIYSCSSSSLKENINKTGDMAGQAIGEFASGVSTGVKKAIEPKIEISDNLKQKGLSFGKIMISSDTARNDNLLTIYTIFNVDFSGIITAKAFDKKNLEMGRVKVELKGKKDDAMFVEFHFDRRTDINNDSRLTLE